MRRFVMCLTVLAGAVVAASGAHAAPRIVAPAPFSAGTASAQAAGADQQQGAEGEGQAAGTQQQEHPGSQLPILYVTSVEVIQSSLEPHLSIVRAQGMVSSKGWGGPFLAPVFVGKPLAGHLDLQLIASTPQQ